MAERTNSASSGERSEPPEYWRAMGRAMEDMAPYVDWSAYLQDRGVLATKSLIAAFRKVRRYDFLPPDHAKEAGFNGPIPIGHGQTNSQPLVVAHMLESLQPKYDNYVLDFGAGSAWTTGLIAAVVGKRGRVVGTEAIPELVEFGNKNLAKYDFPHAQVAQASAVLGAPGEGPFDRILVSARMPEEWLSELTAQLHPLGGRLVAPVSRNMEEFEAGGSTQDLIAITRRGPDLHREMIHEGVNFLPTVRPRAAS